MKNTMDMTKGNVYKLIFFFALPLMFGNIFQQLYVVVDTAIVGRGVGMNALAAIGCVDWLNWMVLGIVQGYAQGFSVKIAQKYGEKDYASLKRIIAHSAVLSVGIAILCMVVGELGLPFFMKILRVPQELVSYSCTYLGILFAGIPAVMFFNFCSSILRAIGDSKTPLIAMMIAALTNIVLDLYAVFVLEFGVAGAALATVFSQCLSGLICARKIWGSEVLRFSLKDEKDKILYQSLIRVGTPLALKNIIIALGGIVISMVVNGFGTSFIAGFTATNKLYGLLEIAAISYGYAITTYVGQNYGAKMYERIKEGVKAATVLALITSVVIAILMFVFGRDITMLFISTDQVEMAKEAGNVAYYYLVAMAVSLPVLYILYVYQATLQGLGDTIVSMYAGVLELVTRCLLSLLVVCVSVPYGIFIAEVAAWYVGAFFLVYFYKKRIKQGFN